jgi:16S rRNA (guanine966-N2)-methyltransferase
LIRENVERLRLIGQTKLWRRDATRLGPCRGAPYDLIFADPPYKSGLGAAALASAREGGWIASGAVVVLETALDEPAPQPPGLVAADDREYGETRVLIFRDAAAGPLETVNGSG